MKDSSRTIAQNAYGILIILLGAVLFVVGTVLLFALIDSESIVLLILAKIAGLAFIVLGYNILLKSNVIQLLSKL